MMTEEELILLAQIRKKVKEKPDFINVIMATATQGVVDAVDQYREMAADMETLASTAIFMAGQKRVTKKTKEKFEQLALSKLTKYEDKTFFKWDWALKDKECSKEE